jgi:hypothetical protein
MTAEAYGEPTFSSTRRKGFPTLRHRAINAVHAHSGGTRDVPNQASIDAAMKVLDDFMAAFNARDVAAWRKTFNFPSVRLASNALTLIDEDYHQPEMFGRGALADWDHSAWARRQVIHAGDDKVHIDTRFVRYRKDGSVLGAFDSIYVVTRENGHWGVKARSSFAP